MQAYLSGDEGVDRSCRREGRGQQLFFLLCTFFNGPEIALVSFQINNTLSKIGGSCASCAAAEARPTAYSAAAGGAASERVSAAPCTPLSPYSEQVGGNGRCQSSRLGHMAVLMLTDDMSVIRLYIHVAPGEAS